jgi:hypothetical protein
MTQLPRVMPFVNFHQIVADSSFVAGRMLNRFGKDIETIDLTLASSLQVVNSSLASFFVSILTVSWVLVLPF